MRIVYCTDTIWHPGGIQRVALAKADALARIDGNEVWVVTTERPQGKPIFPVSDKVHFVNLTVNYYDDDWKSRFHRLKGIIIQRGKHRKQMRLLLQAISPDIVIATGTSEKSFLPRLRAGRQTAFIREIHFSKYYRRYAAQSHFDLIAARLSEWIDYGINLPRYNRVVILTEEDKKSNWASNDKVIVIPDPVIGKPLAISQLSEPEVVAAGRLVEQKNFASLLRAWRKVHASYPRWSLSIYGEGSLRQSLQAQIEHDGLSDSVRLMGYADDLMPHLARASIFAFSSVYEGFGMVLVEAMKCGLPVVSYRCPCGPQDIISDGRDGFLVPVGDEQMLADRICELAGNEGLRKSMGAAAQEKAGCYAMDLIIARWIALFSQLLAEKTR